LINGKVDDFASKYIYIYTQNKLSKNKLKPKKIVVKERRRHTFFFIWAHFGAISMWYIATYMLVK
jgi:hypothetical protein